MKRIAMLFALLLPLSAWAETFVEGKDYQLIARPSMPTPSTKVEVREFFWYGCPHCYKLEPELGKWLKTKPAGAVFIRTPAALTPEWQIAAKGYYAAEAKGLVDKTHQMLFDAVHAQNRRDLVADEAALAKFYMSQGADANFPGLMGSMVVLGKVNAASNLAKSYAIEGVPSLVINGKYLVDYRAGAPERMMQVVTFLVDKEKKEGTRRK